MKNFNESYEQYLFESAKLFNFTIRIGDLVPHADGSKKFEPNEVAQVTGDSIDEFIDNLKRKVVEITGTKLSDASEQGLRKRLFNELQKLFAKVNMDKFIKA